MNSGYTSVFRFRVTIVFVRVFVLARVCQRHPELTTGDVLSAFENHFLHAQRTNGSWLGIGTDSRGRDIEMLYRIENDEVLIYRAFTPPTKKFLREIAQLQRRKH